MALSCVGMGWGRDGSCVGGSVYVMSACGVYIVCVFCVCGFCVCKLPSGSDAFCPWALDWKITSFRLNYLLLTQFGDLPHKHPSPY